MTEIPQPLAEEIATIEKSLKFARDSYHFKEGGYLKYIDAFHALDKIKSFAVLKDVQPLAEVIASLKFLSTYHGSASEHDVGGICKKVNDIARKSLTALEAFAEKDEGMTLPVLPKGWNVRTLFKREDDEVWGVVINFYKPGDWICADAKSGEGLTPRAAILDAIAQIPKQDGGK